MLLPDVCASLLEVFGFEIQRLNLFIGRTVPCVKWKREMTSLAKNAFRLESRVWGWDLTGALF